MKHQLLSLSFLALVSACNVKGNNSKSTAESASKASGVNPSQNVPLLGKEVKAESMKSAGCAKYSALLTACMETSPSGQRYLLIFMLSGPVEGVYIPLIEQPKNGPQLVGASQAHYKGSALQILGSDKAYEWNAEFTLRNISSGPQAGTSTATLIVNGKTIGSDVEFK